MAKARDFRNDGNNQDLSLENWFDFACAEVYTRYGDIVKVDGRGIQKFGENIDLDIADGILEVSNLAQNEELQTTNTIDTLSSSNAADTQVIRVEGIELQSDGSTSFVVQFITLNGQNKVSLDRPLMRATRARNADILETLGDVYVYRDTAITGGIPDDLSFAHVKLEQTDQTSLKASLAIASGAYLALTSLNVGVGRQGAAAVDFRLKAAKFGNPLVTRDLLTVSNNLNEKTLRFEPFEIFEPDTDIILTAQTTSNNTPVSAVLFGIALPVV